MNHAYNLHFFLGVLIDPCCTDNLTQIWVILCVTMRSSTTSTALLCLLAGAVAAIHSPQTGEQSSMEPDETAELNHSVVSDL